MSKKPASNLSENGQEVPHNVPWFTFGRRETFEELTQKWREQKARVLYLSLLPKFRFFVSVTHPNEFSEALRLAKEFQGQSYPHWEVWFLTSKKARDLNHRIGPLDDGRFRVISQADASAVEPFSIPADGCQETDYVGWMECSTTFSPVGLFFLAESVGEFASPALLYWNAVSVSGDGNELRARVKRPRFSPYALSYGNYLENDWVVRAALLANSNAKDYFSQPTKFLNLFVTETQEWKLQPAVLSYHRQAFFSELKLKSANPPSVEIEDPAPLTVIVCFKDKADWTARAVMDFERAAGYLEVSFVLIDNGSQTKERDSLERSLGFLSKKIRYFDFPKPFNFAAMHNWAISELVATESIFLLNNDVFWGEGSVKEILAVLAQPDVATVGIPLKYPSGKYQHLGFRAWVDAPPHQIRVAPVQQTGPLAFWSREVFANTFAACFLKRSLFLKLGGLSELDMANGFGDVAFNLEAVRQGYRNLFYATAWASHLESGTRGRKYEYWEEACLMRKYSEELRRMEAEQFAVEEFGGGDWLSPLVGTLKETMRKKGGQWDALRETLRAISSVRWFGRGPEKLTP